MTEWTEAQFDELPALSADTKSLLHSCSFGKVHPSGSSYVVRCKNNQSTLGVHAWEHLRHAQEGLLRSQRDALTADTRGFHWYRCVGHGESPPDTQVLARTVR